MRLILTLLLAAQLWGARSFNATTSILTDTTPNENLNNLATFTYCAWIYSTGAGESSGGRIVNKGGSNFLRKLLTQTTSTGERILLQINKDTSNATATSGTISLNSWLFVCGSYVASDGGPRLWSGTASVAVAEMTYAGRTDGAGSVLGESGQAISIGNRPAGDRTFNGRIAEVYIYGSVLTAAQMDVLRRGEPLPGALLCAQIYGAVDPEPDPCGGNALVSTDTTAADHAPVAPAFGWRAWLFLRDWLLPIPAFIGGTR